MGKLVDFIRLLHCCGSPGYRRRILPEIEVVDLAHIYGARKLADLGLNDRPHVRFVMVIKNALPAEGSSAKCQGGRNQRAVSR